mmetsp:Transcript_37499/g.67839  ORF Transcript_37499/g.67839 Transcript_37499/m.67839 type:complete len:86 (-) Transcript_37499:1005-1262(-)
MRKLSLLKLEVLQDAERGFTSWYESRAAISVRPEDELLISRPFVRGGLAQEMCPNYQRIDVIHLQLALPGAKFVRVRLGGDSITC